MRHLTLHLSIALLAFAVSMTVAKLWADLSTPESNMPKTERVKGPLLPPFGRPVGPVTIENKVLSSPPPPLPTPTLPGTYVVISGGVLNGKAISKPAPIYPPIGMAARAQGTVTVQILVDETGNVISATAVSGHPLLRAAAVAAAKQARFSPTTFSGQPVKVFGVITYNFVLE